ncbi:hypothetical protein HDE_11035 [Halotydeus destructor]|nr:hypothetical protein HDE_11035 [Halotydeus destructor]
MFSSERKPAKAKISTFGKLFRFAVAAELLAFFGCATVYYQVNGRPDQRYTLHKNYPFILDCYYKFIQFRSDYEQIIESDKAYFEKKDFRG